jgi:4-hydroxy-3-polyprenylbenzoate decarboxylase
VVRETPLSDIHIENMLRLSRMGAVIFPPVPAFYNHPKTIDDLVDQTVLRILDQFNLRLSSDDRWSGKMTVSTKRSPPAPKSRK